MASEITEDQKEAIALAVQEIGGHAAVASMLGYADRRNVWPWTSGSRPVPPEIAPTLERGSNGKVTVERLCPQARWVRIADKTWPHPKGRPLLDTAREEPTAAKPEKAPSAAPQAAPTRRQREYNERRHDSGKDHKPSNRRGA
jgi:DNA-binding transcriptional regulator YdaS (Cro superfamily)